MTQDYIDKHPFFVLFTPEQKKEIASHLYPVSIDKGTTIIAQNEKVERIYFILQGIAVIIKHVENADECHDIVLAYLKKNECIGLNSLGFYSITIDTNANVCAVTDMKLFALDVDILKLFINSNESLYYSLKKI